MLRNVTQSFKLGRINLEDLNHEKWAWVLEFAMCAFCMGQGH